MSVRKSMTIHQTAVDMSLDQRPDQNCNSQSYASGIVKSSSSKVAFLMAKNFILTFLVIIIIIITF